MIVKNIVATSVTDFGIQVKQLISTGFNPTLGIVFIDVEYNHAQVAKILTDDSIQFIGCSSSGEIANGKVYSKTISASFFDIDKSWFSIINQTVDVNQSYRAGIELASKGKERFENPAFLTLFTLNINGEKLIEGARDAVGKEPNLFGGMAADDVSFQPYVFTKTKKDVNGISTLVLDNDRIEFNSFAIDGWEPIGTEHTITKSKNNIIYEINEEPALDFFKKFFGFYSDPLAQNEEDVSTVNSQYPLQIIREDGAVLRAPLNSDTTSKALIMAGPVNEGERFKFSIAPGFEVIEETIDSFKEFKTKVQKPDALLLFSCKARHWAFGPMIEEEVEALHDLWEVPYHGFFTFGEVGKNKNQSTNFFNETCCLVTLKEK